MASYVDCEEQPPCYQARDYEPLPETRGYIRVLILRGSSHEKPLVDCELVVNKFSNEHNVKKDYEALSWCWGTVEPSACISIRKDGDVYAKKVSPNLLAALKALQYPTKDRYLWIDAICINQQNQQEKSHQVRMMSEIFGRAKQICVWLGDSDRSSRIALRFIRNEILQLQNFDELCQSGSASEKWTALLELMQRPWFSRRWVVQEIALARRAVVYCGTDKVSWTKFSAAVELFVEVESEVHTISKAMKRNPDFHYVPESFENISALGASLLVEATSKLFRDYSFKERLEAKVESAHKSSTRYNSKSDSIATSITESDSDSDSDADIQTSSVFLADRKQPLQSLEYLVTSFSVFNVSVAHDAVYALLAIARDTIAYAGEESTRGLLHEHARNALEAFSQKKRYKVDYTQPYSDAYSEFVQFCVEQSDPTRALDIICRPWAPEAPRNEMTDQVPLPSWISRLNGTAPDISLQPGAGMTNIGRKNADTLVGSPSSGQSLQRNYSAAESKGIDFRTFRFRKRVTMGHHSMYVKGFMLDRIITVLASSHGGAIPSEWAIAAGWRNVPFSNPPDDFWRILVADRGRDGRNPPAYYSHTCKELFVKGGLSNGYVNTTDFIHDQSSSIVAQFCRRVQAVIWNRRMIKTRGGRLGLASQKAENGDIVCILYGCSVPVVLRRKWKTVREVEQEVDEDVRNWLNSFVSAFRQICNNRKASRLRKKELRKKWVSWNEKMLAIWQKDEDWHKKWQQTLSERRPTQQTQQDSNANRLTQRLMRGEEEMGFFLRVRDESEDAYEWRLRRKSFVFWKNEKRKVEREKGNVWNEPSPRWHEFELYIRCGRLWKAIWLKRKALRDARQQVPRLEQEQRVARKAVQDEGKKWTLHIPSARPFDAQEEAISAVQEELRNDSLDDLYLRHAREKFMEKFEDYSSAELKAPEQTINSDDLEHIQRLKQNWCYYELLGECYVHGMMDGQAIAYQNEKGIATQVFELR